MSFHTFVTKSHAFSDEKETVEILTSQEVRRIACEVANEKFSQAMLVIQEEVKSLQQRIAKGDMEQEVELEKQKTALESQTYYLHGEVQTLKKQLEGNEARLHDIDGMEERLRGSMGEKLNMMSSRLPQMAHEALSPHFNHLATQMRQLQEEEERLRAMHKTLRSELALVRSIAAALCGLLDDSMPNRKAALQALQKALAELQKRLS